MARFFAGVGIFAAVAALLAWNFYFKPRRDAGVEQPAVTQAPLPDRTVSEEPEPKPEPEPPPEFVAPPQAPVDAPELPGLDDSDATVFDALAERLASGSVAGLLADQSVVRKIVVTVDNLPRDTVSMKIRAVEATPGRFIVAGDDDDLTLDADNYARYVNFLARLEATDPVATVDLYVGFYPLFQQAYEELGYPGRQFHTRVVEVIDHLLAAPDVEGPVRLERPHVLYRYADPELEARSAGQKVLMRMGDENSARAKAWLRRVRAELLAREVA